MAARSRFPELSVSNSAAGKTPMSAMTTDSTAVIMPREVRKWTWLAYLTSCPPAGSCSFAVAASVPIGGSATIAVSPNADGGTPIGAADPPGAAGMAAVGSGAMGLGVAGAGCGPGPYGTGATTVADIAEAAGGIPATARPGFSRGCLSAEPIGPGRTGPTPAGPA